MSSAKSSSRATTKKDSNKKRIVVLHIPPEHLAKIWDLKLPSPKPSSLPPPPDLDPSPSAQPSDSAQRSSDSNDTPAPSATNAEADPNSLAPPKPDSKKRKSGASTGGGGRKRAPPAIDPEAPPRERGRPGPKKKPRLPDGTIDRTNDSRRAPVTGTTAPVSHKLGPKANTGAINAGLRALDRTGKPCRRWERKGFQLKSFTGATWSMSSWKAPPKDLGFSGDVKSDSSGSSDLKPADSSAVASERSHDGGAGGDAAETTLMNGIESSPVPPTTA